VWRSPKTTRDSRTTTTKGEGFRLTSIGLKGMRTLGSNGGKGVLASPMDKRSSLVGTWLALSPYIQRRDTSKQTRAYIR
jgi:hypothetical protein